MNLKKRGGVWYLRTWVRGKEYFLSTGVRVHLKHSWQMARERAAEIESELWKETFGQASKTTVQQWYERYERTYIPRHSDRQRITDILAPFVAAFGHRRLDQITRSDCVGYLNERGVGRKPGTIAREQGAIGAFFQRAIDEGLLRANPWRGIRRPRYEARTRTLSPEEQATLMEALNPEYQRFVVVALGTGLRESELLGLRPADVDRTEMLLSVRAETAKGGKSRAVPLLSDVLDALDRQQQFRKIGPKDVYWAKQRRIVRQYIVRAAAKVKIPHITVHDLRRTFGTRHALSGTPPKVLMELMGHSSIQTTMKYYVHVRQEDMARWMHKAELNLPTTQEQGRLLKFPDREAQ